MRRVLLLLPVAFFFLPSIVDAATISRPVNGLGLVAYWSLNEGTSTIAGDFSGGGHPGTITGAVWTQGKRGNALSLNGNGDIVTMGAVSSLSAGTSDFTVMAWVYYSNTPSTSKIITTNSQAAGSNRIFMSIETDNTLRLLSIGDSGVNLYSTSQVPKNRWVHIAVTRVAGSAKMYMDGVEVSTTGSVSTGNVGSTNNWSIGGRTGTASLTFDGKIDEVRVYSRELSATEITAAYTAGLVKINVSRTVVTNGLVGWWTMDGNDMAMNLTDKSGNGNTGYLVNMSTSTAQIPGKIGSALNFDGGDDYAYVNDSDSLDTPNGLTVSAWIYDSNDGTQNHTLNKDDNTNRSWIIRRQTDTTGNYHLWNSGGTLRQFIPANSWKVNEWFHMTYVVSVSGSTITLEVFINGVSVGTDSFSGTAIRTVTAPVMMSKNTIGGTTEKAQRLDDVRIYNRALTAAEAKQIYNEGAGTKINVNTTNDSSLDQGLISYWSFNGPDVTDQVYDRINGNNGYFYGTATSTAKKIGKVGQAFDFNGSSDSVEVVHNANQLPTSGLTISAWMKADSHGGNSRGRIIDKSTGTQAQGGFTLFTTDSGGAGQIGFAINNSTAIQSGAGSYALGQWVHVVATATAAGASIIYINGVQTTSGTTAALSGLTTTNALSIGKRSAASDRYFDGIIDEVRMYGRVLTPAEVKQLYNAGR